MPLSYQAAEWPPEAEKRASFLPPCLPALPPGGTLAPGALSLVLPQNHTEHGPSSTHTPELGPKE